MPTTTTTMAPGAAGEIYLGIAGDYTLLSAFGRTYTESIDELSRQERTASGRLVKEIIARKKRFTLTWREITPDAVQDLIDLYELEEPLRLIVYYTDSEHTTYDVLMQPIDRTRILVAGDGLWGNVQAVLEEI